MLAAARRPRHFRRAVGGSVLVQGGDGQTGTVATTLGTPLSALVRDADGNPVVGATVWWATIADGAITPSSVTNGSGIATATWTLGTQAVIQSATASVAGVGGAVFTATATAAAAALILAVSTTDQNGSASTPVGTPPSVRVTDVHGNVKAGVTVTFTVTGGGGSRSPGTVNTDADGIATLTSWTLGPSVGANTLEATVAGLTGSPVLFQANAITATPASLATVGGTGQTGIVAGAAAAPFGVRVRDGSSVGIPGVTVTWLVRAGGGSLSAPTSVTDSNGDAFITLTTGQTVGLNQVMASVLEGALNTGDNAWNLTTVPGAKAQLVIVAQPAPNGSSGQTLPGQPVIRIADQYGNQTADTDTVTVTVVSGNATVAAGGTKAAVAGLATFTALALNDVDGGPNTLQFAIAGPITIVSEAVTLVPPVPVGLAIQTTVQPVQVDQTIPAITVWIVDAGDAKVPGAAHVVTAALTVPGGATLNGTLSVAAVDGAAVFSDLSVSGAGDFTLTFTETTLGSDVSNSFTVSAAGDLSGRPNEPGGFSLVTETSFATGTQDGWLAPTGGTLINTQTAAPKSQPSAWRCSKGPGSGAGSMGTTERSILASSKERLYWAYWFWVPTNFQGHATGILKVFYPVLNSFAYAFTTVSGVGLGQLKLGFFLQGCQPGLGGNDSTGHQTLTPGASGNFSRGAWHRAEGDLTLNTGNQADGILRQWIDGVLCLNKTNVCIRGTAPTSITGAPVVGNTTKFSHVRANPIWGGTGDAVASGNVAQIIIDHIYVSG